MVFELCLSLSPLSNLRGEETSFLLFLFPPLLSFTGLAGATGRLSVLPEAPPPPPGKAWIADAVYAHGVVCRGDSPFTLLDDHSLDPLKCFENISGFPTKQHENISWQVWKVEVTEVSEQVGPSSSPGPGVYDPRPWER